MMKGGVEKAENLGLEPRVPWVPAKPELSCVFP